MSAVVELLQELVRIPSVNPKGNPGTEHVNEERCAKFLGEVAAKAGAEVRYDEVFPERPNILARFPSDKPGKPRLLFAPHTDTVSVAGMTIDPFGGEVRDGKVWGRGSSDTKGPMAAMLQAIIESRDILPHLSHEIWFAGLMSEEENQDGSKDLAKREKFDFAIIGEPTDLQMVHTHKGSVRVCLKSHGVAAHSSIPQLGKNAIEPMMEALLTLRREFDRTFAGLEDAVLGVPTCNIGTITGGSKVNIVPDYCEAWVDFRTVPGQEIEAFLQTLQAQFSGVEFHGSVSHPLHTKLDHPVAQKLVSLGAQPTGAPWFCDAAHLAACGTPAVALGPGSIEQAHTADEFIKISDLEDGLQFFKKFLHQLLPS